MITQIPENYAPARKEIIYTIEGCDESVKTNIEIADAASGKSLGVKQLAGQTRYSVNIAPYVEGALCVEPLGGEECRFVKADRRTVEVEIEVDGEIKSLPRVFTAAENTVGAGLKMSTAPEMKKIAWDETDEIAIVAPGSEVAARVAAVDCEGVETELAVLKTNAQDGVYALVVSMADLAAKIAQVGADAEKQVEIRVRIDVDGNESFTQKYEIAEPDKKSVRVCWANSFGAVDYYTFLGVEQEKIEIQKENILTCEGVKTVAVRRENVLRIVSRYENEQTFRWIAQMAEAENVWIVEDQKFVPVVVEAKEVVVSSQKLNRLEIDVRR